MRFLFIVTCHFFLLDLMVNDMTGGELLLDILNGYSHIHHKHHCVVHKVGNFIYGFSLIISLTCYDYLGALLTDFLENLVSTLAEKDALKALEIKNNGKEMTSLLAIIYALENNEEGKNKYFQMSVNNGNNPDELKNAIEFFLKGQASEENNITL